MRTPFHQSVQQLNQQFWRADAWILWQTETVNTAQVLDADGFGSLSTDQIAEQFHGQQPLFAQVRQQQKPVRATARIAGLNGQQRPLDVWTIPLKTESEQQYLQLFFYESSRADELQQADRLHAIPDQLTGGAQQEQPPSNWQHLGSQIVQQTESSERITNLLDHFCLQFGVERSSLYQVNQGQLKLTAVSGAIVWDQRSPVIADLQQRAEALFADAGQADLAETIAADGSRTNRNQLLFASSGYHPPIWCLLVETSSNSTPLAGPQFDRDWPVWSSWLTLLVEQTSKENRGKSRWKQGVLLLLAAGLLAIPIPLKITGEGTFWPKTRTEIFAPETGMIAAEDLQLPEDLAVENGQQLLKITSAELGLQFGQVAGELATVQEQIRSLQSTRVESTASPASRENPEWDKSIRLAELTARKTGLLAELKLLQQRLDSLQVVAGQAGTILTWQAADLLKNRPISRGQLLLTIGDLTAEWEVRAYIADRDLAWFRSAVHNNEQQVQIRTAAAADLKLTGRLEQISPLVVSKQPGEASAEVVIHLPDRPENILPGTRCRIETVAGHYPAGFVWFRQLLETARSYLSW